jgi:hypothetical protein
VYSNNKLISPRLLGVSASHYKNIRPEMPAIWRLLFKVSYLYFSVLSDILGDGNLLSDILGDGNLLSDILGDGNFQWFITDLSKSTSNNRLHK